MVDDILFGKKGKKRKPFYQIGEDIEKKLETDEYYLKKIGDDKYIYYDKYLMYPTVMTKKEIEKHKKETAKIKKKVRYKEIDGLKQEIVVIEDDLVRIS
jgi:hypothetical protein